MGKLRLRVGLAPGVVPASRVDSESHQSLEGLEPLSADPVLPGSSSTGTGFSHGQSEAPEEPCQAARSVCSQPELSRCRLILQRFLTSVCLRGEVRCLGACESTASPRFVDVCSHRPACVPNYLIPSQQRKCVWREGCVFLVSQKFESTALPRGKLEKPRVHLAGPAQRSALPRWGRGSGRSSPWTPAAAVSLGWRTGRHSPLWFEGPWESLKSASVCPPISRGW